MMTKASADLSGKERDPGIALTRVVAMLFIIFCHLSSFRGPGWLPQVFNVGVYVFLLISGWLYSKKEVPRPTIWLIHRWKKLCIPLLIWILVTELLSILVFKTHLGVKNLILFSTNLQGLSWVFPSFPSIERTGLTAGLDHLWFITIIFLCYILLIVFRPFKKDRILAAGGILSIPLGLIGINLFYFVCFYMGSFLENLSHKGKKLYLAATAFLIIALLIRLAGRHFLDGTTAYDIIIVNISHILLATWILLTITVCVKNFHPVRRFAESRFISKADELSYYIYITHYLFLCDQFGLKAMTDNISVQILLFTILTLGSAILLKRCSTAFAGKKK